MASLPPKRVRICLAPRITAEQTVAEVARDPRALEVLEAMSINHCSHRHTLERVLA